MYKTHGQKTGTNYQPQVLLDLSHQLSTVVLVILATIPDWVGTNALFAGDSIKLADSNFCSKSHVQSTFWDLPRLATYQDKQKKNRIAKNTYEIRSKSNISGQKFVALLCFLEVSFLPLGGGKFRTHKIDRPKAMRDRRGSMDDAFSPFVSMPSVVDLNAGGKRPLLVDQRKPSALKETGKLLKDVCSCWWLKSCTSW